MRGSKSSSRITGSSDYKTSTMWRSTPNLSYLDNSECADTEDEEKISDLSLYLGSAISKNSPLMVSKAISLGVSVEKLHLDFFFKTLLDKKKLNDESIKTVDNYDLAILDLLLSSGVEIKKRHLNIVIYLENYDLIKLLLKYSVKIEKKHIAFAESLNLISIVKLLKIEKGQYFHLYNRVDKIYWP